MNASGNLAAAVMPTYTSNRVVTTDGSGNLAATTSSTTTSAGASDSGKFVLLGANGKINNNMIDSTALTPSLANATGTLGVSKGGTGTTSFNAGELLVGNGTSAIGTVASSVGNVLVGTVSGWSSTTADSANLVDKSSNQTVAGDKTWSGDQSFNGNMTFGNGGSTFSRIIRCSENSDTYSSSTTVSISCAGATSTSVAQCSLDNVPAGTWTLAYTSPAADTIRVRLQRSSGSWTAGINCIVFVP
jgi:hypothetical protein